MDESRVKGYALLSYVTPLQREKSALWAEVETQLSHDGQRFFSHPIYANSWYERRYLHDFMDAYRRAIRNDPAELRELGAMAARYQLHVIYRIFLKFATPAMVFNRASSVWSRQSTSGSFVVVEEGDDFLVGQLDDSDLPKGIPEVMAGWSDTIISMLGRTPYPTTIEPVSPRRWRFRVSWVSRARR
ncbi:MAG: hypothetical protein R3B13_01620 [Polyangiaceae bacterium]